MDDESKGSSVSIDPGRQPVGEIDVDEVGSMTSEEFPMDGTIVTPADGHSFSIDGHPKLRIETLRDMNSLRVWILGGVVLSLKRRWRID